MGIYTVNIPSDITLAAATPKTILAAINSANGVIKLVEWSVSFSGTSATDTPVLIDLCAVSTTTAGTATAHTPVQKKGPSRTAQFTAKRDFTVEPTAVAVLNSWRCHPQSGMVVQYPLGREPDQWVGSYSLTLRVTAPAQVACRGYMDIEE